jgi:hypothetical protein
MPSRQSLVYFSSGAPFLSHRYRASKSELSHRECRSWHGNIPDLMGVWYAVRLYQWARTPDLDICSYSAHVLRRRCLTFEMRGGARLAG